MIISNKLFLIFVIYCNGQRMLVQSSVLDQIYGLFSSNSSEEESSEAFIPSTRSLTRFTKHALFGLPEKAVFSTIHEACSLLMQTDLVAPLKPINIRELSFQLHTPCRVKRFPLLKAEKLLQSNDFKPSKPVVLFVGGWFSSLDSNSILALAEAYNCRGGFNFLSLDTSDYITTLYTWSAFNTQELGQKVASALRKLHPKIRAEKFHLIGFSLGAHIVGSAGKYFQKYTGKKIGRITGLDPANPCFNKRQSLQGIQKTDATFVDIIHTNPGVLGKRETLGHVDFYPEGFTPIKPGCNMFGCSHIRAWKYYAQSVYRRHEQDFIATLCSSLRDLNRGRCRSSKISMGFGTPRTARGQYILSVNRFSPFGANAKESKFGKDCMRVRCRKN